MKKILSYLLVAWTVLAASACTKTAADRFSGSYTFKTGGSLLLESVDDPATRITLPLRSAYGRMDVTRLDQDGRVLVSLNSLGGPVDIYPASVDADIVRLDAKEYSFSAGLGSQTIPLGFLELTLPGREMTARLTLSGTGHLYDGRTLLIEFTCSGPVTVGGKNYNATGVDMICSATKN